MTETKENIIEFYGNEKRITVTFGNKKFINKIKRMASTNDEIKIVADDKKNNGFLVAHLPLKCLSLRNPKHEKKELTAEQKEALKERLKRGKK